MKLEYKLKSITDASWILYHNGNKKAMIVTTDSGIMAIGDLPYKNFIDFDDFAKKLGAVISFDETEKAVEPEVSKIDGYPVKHPNTFDVKQEQYSSYTKKLGSSIRFAAGYFGILFNYGWVTSYCPKVVTLNENKWIGPFRTRLELLSAISAKKKEPTV